MEKQLDKRIASVVSRDGMILIHWISKVLSLVFLVELVLGGIHATLSYGYSILNNIVIGMGQGHEIMWLLLLYVVYLVSLWLPYFIINYLAKWSEQRCDYKITKRSLYFASGVYLIVSQLPIISRMISVIASLLFNARWGWGVHINASDIFSTVIYAFLPWVDIFIGLIFIKKSRDGHMMQENEPLTNHEN